MCASSNIPDMTVTVLTYSVCCVTLTVSRSSRVDAELTVRYKDLQGAAAQQIVLDQPQLASDILDSSQSLC